MKIKILKNIDVDIDKTKLQEVWPKYLQRNDVFNVWKEIDTSLYCVSHNIHGHIGADILNHPPNG
jgi:hypothetical protein